MSENNYIKLGDLDVYKLSIILSDLGWNIYKGLNWQDRKIIGDQFITAIDSVGANIAEGYGRFHYLDRIRFYYNARGSLLEAKHWAFLLMKRGKINQDVFNQLLTELNNLHYKLNSFISSTHKTKSNI